MARKRLSTEQIVTKLHHIEMLQAPGKTIAIPCKEAGMMEQDYYRWQSEHGVEKLEHGPLPDYFRIIPGCF